MRALAVALALAAAGFGVQAHPMPHSTLVVETKTGDVELTASIPISELKAATDEAPASEAGSYVLRHVSVTGADGRSWLPMVREVEPGELDGHAVMSVTVGFSASPGAAPRAGSLRYDAVIHRIASHHVLVYRRTGEGLVPLVRLQAPAATVSLP